MSIKMFDISRYSGVSSIANSVCYELLSDMFDKTDSREVAWFIEEYAKKNRLKYFNGTEIVVPKFYGVRVCLSPNEYVVLVFDTEFEANKALEDFENYNVGFHEIEDGTLDGLVHVHWTNSKLKNHRGFELVYVHTRKQTPQL